MYLIEAVLASWEICYLILLILMCESCFNTHKLSSLAHFVYVCIFVSDYCYVSQSLTTS